MDEKPSEQADALRRQADAARRDRDDSFARHLGDGWETVEPGIYRQVRASDPEQPERVPEPLDEALRERLPGDPVDPDARRESAPPVSEPERWWRRR